MDIVERLRWIAVNLNGISDGDAVEYAADEIERLREALALIACRKDACHCKHLTGFPADKMCCAGIARSALGGDD